MVEVVWLGAKGVRDKNLPNIPLTSLRSGQEFKIICSEEYDWK